MVQHDQAVRDRKDDPHQMLDHDDGNAELCDLADQLERPGDFGRIETGIDLVEHEEARLHGQALRELQTLATCQGKRGGRSVGHVGKAGKFELLTCCRVRVVHAAGAPGKQRAGRDVLQYRHLGERLHDLEGARETEPRDLVRPPVCDVLPVEAHAAAAGRMHAGAVRADEPDDFPLRDREAHALDGIEPAKAARDVLEFKQCAHAGAPRRATRSRNSGTMPFGRNRINTTMMKPRAAAWMVKKLRQTNSSKAMRIKAPIAGPKIVPSPPSITITNGLIASNTSNTSGGSI